MNLKILEGSENYVCTIVQIDNLHEIENCDNIQRTVIFGNNVIVSKKVQLNDIMCYFVSGTKLNSEYCHKNNLYDNKDMNYNKEEKGFISHKQCRVKAIKLRGIISDGMLMPLSSFNPFLEQSSVNQFKVGDSFNLINDNLLCQKYIIPTKPVQNNVKQGKSGNKFNKIIENQFYFHNSTENLRRNYHKLQPNDIIGIHYKKHGTSAVFANILTNRPLKWYEKILIKLGVNINTTQYDIIYSSRKVIKNKYINPEQVTGFYNEDIWRVVKDQIKHLVPKNWTLYGEIIGFLPEKGYIQPNYDYKCKPGEYKFYVYKISIVNPDGKIVYLTDKQIEEYCEKVGLLYKDTFIYYGRAIDRFNYKEEGKEWSLETWREKFLEVLEATYNEKDCYMCNNKVPEEGIIVRIEHLEEYEAYKLKSHRFLLLESEQQENEQNNIEDET